MRSTSIHERMLHANYNYKPVDFTEYEIQGHVVPDNYRVLRSGLGNKFNPFGFLIIDIDSKEHLIEVYLKLLGSGVAIYLLEDTDEYALAPNYSTMGNDPMAELIEAFISLGYYPPAELCQSFDTTWSRDTADACKHSLQAHIEHLQIQLAGYNVW